MIKINLLLTRKEKKRVGIRKEFVVLIISLIFLFASFTLIQWKMGNDKKQILAKISDTKNEINQHKTLIAEIKKGKESLKIYQDKLNDINSLLKEKGNQAKLLDEISMVKPEKIQLESLKKVGAKLGIEGVALDDETVASFMTNLRKSKFFKNVDLIVSEQTERGRMKVKRFNLSCEVFLM